MDFEWDRDKNEKNKQKHGVDFGFASKAFFDPNLISRLDDRQDYGEEREVALAMYFGVILSVVYTWRGETIRIISARKATKMSRKDIMVSFDVPEVTEEDGKAAARLATRPDAETLCDEENPPMPENVVFRKGLCPPSQKKGRGELVKGWQ